MTDLTILYYTANTITTECAERVRATLRETSAGLPIISISQKPLDFGTNICVGEIGRSPYNVFKQMLAGAEAATTEFVACCEDDTVYPPEHFLHRPQTTGFAYNTNLWHSEPSMFWTKGGNDSGMVACIANREALLSNLRRRYAKFPTEPPRDNPIHHYWQEPGRTDWKFCGYNDEFEHFQTEQAVVTFNYRGSLWGKRGSRVQPQITRKYLPGWGEHRAFWYSYWPK